MVKLIYGGRYEVSDDGEVYTNVKYKNKTRMVGKVTASGYRMVVLTVDKKKIYKNIHRLVAEEFLPNPLRKREVNHIDGDKLNNNASNLEWVTTRENQIHVRDVIGTKKSKITIGQANEIRKRYAEEKISQRKLAEEFGIGKTEVGAILKGQRWTTQHNFPDTVQLGDAFQVREENWKL